MTLIALKLSGPAFADRRDDTIFAEQAAWWGSAAKGWLCEAADPTRAKSLDYCYEHAYRCARYAGRYASFVVTGR